ncbi:hypothetical protein [Microbacterium hominis]|uniref:hypothetical protein n=1 Tax=Microbacterium hominis TaxID=162426 RepID=UPI0020B6C466|nr:hypothetical protein [Microbacterium hominis]
MSEATRRRRQSPAVYRRRRLALLILLLLVAALVWALIAQPWRGLASEPQEPSGVSSTPSETVAIPAPGSTSVAAEAEADGDADEDAAESDATPSAEPDAAATPSPTASTAPQAAPCRPREVTVEALTDKDSYAAGENPQLSIRLTNTGSEDCTLNVGTATQVFEISSGSDVWWRSTDCQTEPSDMVVLLAAGQTVTSAAPLVWDRTRSSVDSCGDAARQRAAGAARPTT